MTRETLEALLRHPRFNLEEREQSFFAPAEAPLKLLAVAGTDVLRFDGVESFVFEDALLAADCVGIVHGERFTVLPLPSIFAIEAHTEAKSKRRTGFV